MPTTAAPSKPSIVDDIRRVLEIVPVSKPTPVQAAIASVIAAAVEEAVTQTLITDTTAQLITGILGIVLPAVFALVAAIAHHARSKVQVAAVGAVAHVSAASASRPVHGEAVLVGKSATVKPPA